MSDTVNAASEILSDLERRVEETETGVASYVTVKLDVALDKASTWVRDSLFDAGVKEHRALVTGDAKDAEALTEAMKGVDEAYANLWALEAYGRKVRFDRPEEERLSLDAIVRDASARMADSIARGDAEGAKDSARTRIEAHREMGGVADRPLPDCAIEVPTSVPVSLPPDSPEERKDRKAIIKKLHRKNKG
jgi:hypothetical protein